MKQEKIGFVVLHYYVIDKTILCIESILNRIDTKNFEIIVVDNNSLNGTGKELEEKYKNNPKVKVLLSNKNLGFSGGNNLGYDYAKNKLKCDFICLLNNDTEIIQDDFFSVILEEYKKSKFAAMGPEIHLLNDSIKGYLVMHLMNEEELKKEIKRMKKMLFLNKTFLESIGIVLKSIIKKIVKWNKISTYFKEPKEIVPRREMVVLHGCCLVLSPVYVSMFDGLNNKTAFYGEEELLFIRIVQNNLISVYNPKLKIFHAEKAATSAVTKRGYKKRRMIYDSHLKACYAILEEELKDYDSLKQYFKK